MIAIALMHHHLQPGGHTPSARSLLMKLSLVHLHLTRRIVAHSVYEGVWQVRRVRSPMHNSLEWLPAAVNEFWDTLGTLNGWIYSKSTCITNKSHIS